MPVNRWVPISPERGGITTSVNPRLPPTSCVSSGSAYWARSTSIWAPMSAGMLLGVRSGSSPGPSSTMMTTVPITIGRPASANSKNPNGRPPAAAAAWLTMMLTGVPVNASIEPAWAAKASGISSRLGA